VPDRCAAWFAAITADDWSRRRGCCVGGLGSGACRRRCWPDVLRAEGGRRS
jgi:hypothetical protein